MENWEIFEDLTKYLQSIQTLIIYLFIFSPENKCIDINGLNPYSEDEFRPVSYIMIKKLQYC